MARRRAHSPDPAPARVARRFTLSQFFLMMVYLLALCTVTTIIRFTVKNWHLFERGTPVAVVVKNKFTPPPPPPRAIRAPPPDIPLDFMKSKLVLLVSHELSISGGPLLLMELAFLLRAVNAKVCWVTNQRATGTDDHVIYSLEQKLTDRGIQVMSANDQEVVNIALHANLVVLNTAAAGKWLDAVLKEKVRLVLPKTLWWIHDMRCHYFALDYVKHLPFVAGAIVNSNVTAEYWKNRTQEKLRIKMPKTHVVRLGNSKELMKVAKDDVARRILKEHVREYFRVRREDMLFAMINSVSRGKGQDLFLQSFFESLVLIKHKRIPLPSIHAVIVGSDINAQTKFESELRAFVQSKRIRGYVHFVNKTLDVAPYLAAIDVLVQNSQALGEYDGRITIEAMAFSLPVLGTAVGSTLEIVVNGTTGILHPVGKAGVVPLARNMIELATNVPKRVQMGKDGHDRVKKKFSQRQMERGIALAFKDVLLTAKAKAPPPEFNRSVAPAEAPMRGPSSSSKPPSPISTDDEYAPVPNFSTDFFL